MVGQPVPECCLELYQPFLPCTCLHRAVVLPVDVDAVQVVGKGKVSQIVGCFDGLPALSGWELCGSESRDKDSLSGIIIGLFKLLLDGLGVIAKPGKVLSSLGPDEDQIYRPIGQPEGKGVVVVRVLVGIARNTKPSHEIVTPPRLYSIGIPKINRIWHIVTTRSS